jgi:site-specific recombinase XerD
VLTIRNSKFGKSRLVLLHPTAAAALAGYLRLRDELHPGHDRGNSPRTRNAHLAAIHSLFAYAALQHPEHAETTARVLAIPPKRFDKALVTWLTEPELGALLAAPGTAT